LGNRIESLVWFVLAPLTGVALIISGLVLGDLPIGNDTVVPQSHAMFMGAVLIIVPSSMIIVNLRKARRE